MAARFNVSVPVFETVSGIVDVRFVGWLPNGSEEATWTVGATPVPVKLTVCLVPAVPVALPLSVMSTVAVRDPVAVGLNATLIVHEACPNTFPPDSGQGFVAPAVNTNSPGSR